MSAPRWQEVSSWGDKFLRWEFRTVWADVKPMGGGEYPDEMRSYRVRAEAQHPLVPGFEAHSRYEDVLGLDAAKNRAEVLARGLAQWVGVRIPEAEE